MTKEKIEKKAKEIANQWQEPSDYNIARDAATEMADWLLSHQWVSVQDELPKKSEPVLIRNKNGSIARATYSKVGRFDTGNVIQDVNAWILIDVGVRIGNSDVTHWMPIPPLKEEGGKK